MISATIQHGCVAITSTILAAGALLSCGRQDPEEGVPPLEVENRLSGCEEVHEGAGCVPPESGALRWWVRVPEAAVVTVLADGEGLDAEAEAAGDAHRYLLRVPAGASSLELRVTRDSQVHRTRWRLLAGRTCAVLDAIEAARKTGNAERIEELSATVRADDPCGPTALGQLARADLAGGRRDEALAGLRAAMQAQRRNGCLSCEARDGFALSYALTFEARSFDEARAVLDGLEPRLDEAADAWAQVGHYRGVLAFEAGNFRDALSWFRVSVERSQALGLEDQRRATAVSLALSLHRLGRSEEAVEQLRDLGANLPETASACERAVLHNNFAWTALAAAEGASGSARIEALGEIENAFEAALHAYEEGCERVSQIRNVLVNLAHVRQRAGDEAGARLALSRALIAGAGKEPRTRPWLSLVEANLALDGDDPKGAWVLYGKAFDQARDSLQDGAAWQARLGQGRSLEAAGRMRDALVAYREAEAMLDAQVRWIPLVDGLDTFLASREEGARCLVALLLRMNLVEEALQVGRTARARALWSLRWMQRLEALEPRRRQAWTQALASYRRGRTALEEGIANEWQLSDESLPAARASRRVKQRELRDQLERALSLLQGAPDTKSPPPPLVPRPGEMVWLAHPTPDGWAIFAKDAESLVVHRIPGDAPGNGKEAASVLLTPFEPQIERADRIRVLGYGPFRNVDFHALPWRGAPLVATKSVVYGTDLGFSSESDEKVEIASLLLVADPRRDLPSARLEADAVTRALPREIRERLRRMEGHQATRVEVAEAIRSVDAFHYAGHGAFDHRGGWESALPLADGGKLTVGDILALPEAPRVVVLSGCETGRTSDISPLSQVGLAQAFTIAGSRLVLAATRPVPDELASRMSVALYAAWIDEKNLLDVPSKAQRMLLEALPDQDWAAFRSFVP